MSLSVRLPLLLLLFEAAANSNDGGRVWRRRREKACKIHKLLTDGTSATGRQMDGIDCEWSGCEMNEWIMALCADGTTNMRGEGRVGDRRRYRRVGAETASQQVMEYIGGIGGGVGCGVCMDGIDENG